MAPPTLRALATRKCIRHLPQLFDVGSTPYELLEPILKKIQDPKHLHTLELASPHIADHDADLWRAFIVRDIPGGEEKLKTIAPKNPRSWYKVYGKFVREKRLAEDEHEKELEAAMSGLSRDRQANKTVYVEKVIPHQGGSGSRQAFVDGLPNTRLGGGAGMTPSLRNAKKGRDVVAAIRKQSALAARAKGIGRRDEALPNYVTKNQIQAAPAWMVKEQKKPVIAVARPQQNSRVTPSVFAPKRSVPTVADKALGVAIRDDNAAREARLRALTAPKVRSSVSTLTAAAIPAVRHVGSPATSQSRTATPVVRRAVFTPPRTTTTTVEQSERVSPVAAMPVARKRPAPTMFMPAKKRKV